MEVAKFLFLAVALFLTINFALFSLRKQLSEVVLLTGFVAFVVVSFIQSLIAKLWNRLFGTRFSLWTDLLA